MSSPTTAHPPSWALWRNLLNWTPFKIDALGLVTLLGAEEINASVGRLVRSRWLEHLPFLGAYVIAGNRFRSKEPGYNLYNITQGIHTPDLAAWLTRWIKSQDFAPTRNFVRWTVIPPRDRNGDDFISSTISVCLVGMLFALTILQYDMYGMASTLAMGWSVLSRWYMISSIRKGIDSRVSKMCGEKVADGAIKFAMNEDDTYEGKMRAWKKRTAELQRKASGKSGADPEKDPDAGSLRAEAAPHQLLSGWNGDPGVKPVKVLVITSESVTVTMMIPKALMGTGSVFNATIPPAHPFRYGVARWTGWIAFAVQVVTIGQADLVTQICTVALLVIPTVLYVFKLGCDDSNWPTVTKMKDLCRRKLLLPKKAVDDAASKAAHDSFTPISVSQIGSRLLAEVYEWPLSHDFVKDPVDPGKLSSRLYSVPAVKRSVPRRMHLYAWLQLTEPERLSMDKWDLFPHQRDDDNKSWMDTYEHLRGLIGKLKGPAGTINCLDATPLKGAQDIIDKMTPPPAPANGPAASPLVDNAISQSPNGSVTEHQTTQETRSADATPENGVHPQPGINVTFTEGTAIPPPTRTATGLTQASRSSHHSASRRPSVTTDLGSANWMSNRVLQQQAERNEQEEALEDISETSS